MIGTISERRAVAVAGEAGAMPIHIWRPGGTGPWPGCILLPEIFGLTAEMRVAAERIAGLGVMVAMPDLHYRIAPDLVLAADDAGRRCGLELLHAQTRPSVVADLSALHADLVAQPDCFGALSVVGFSAGGHIAYLAATALPFRAAAILYGGWIGNTGIPLSRPEPTVTLTPGMAGTGIKVLYAVGGGDHLIAAEERDGVAAALTEAGIDHQMAVYDSVGHGFMVPGRPTFDEAASADVWARLADLVTPARTR